MNGMRLARAGLACSLLWLLSCSNDAEAAVEALRAGAAPAVGTPDAGAPAATGAPDAGNPAAAPVTLSANVLRVEKAAIVDHTGFDAPLVAATVFLPHGWRAEGGVHWGQQYACTNGYVFNWRATSPDGHSVVAVLPQERWEWNSYGAAPSTPGCASARFSSVREYLEQLVQRLRPGARITGFRVRDDLRQQFAQYDSVTPMPLGETRTWVEAGEITASYREDGREMRGSVGCVVVFSLMRSSSGGSSMEALTGSTFPCYAASAPSDAFDAAFFEAIRRSIQVDPRWEQRIAGHNFAIAQVALRENKKRSDAIARSNEEIARIRDEAWSSHQQSADRRAREFGELMRGVETYDDPDAPTGQAELSNLYDHAWRLDDGSYVLTDDPGFEPWRELGLAGQKLDPVK